MAVCFSLVNDLKPILGSITESSLDYSFTNARDICHPWIATQPGVTLIYPALLTVIFTSAFSIFLSKYGKFHIYDYNYDPCKHLYSCIIVSVCILLQLDDFVGCSIYVLLYCTLQGNLRIEWQKHGHQPQILQWQHLCVYYRYDTTAAWRFMVGCITSKMFTIKYHRTIQNLPMMVFSIEPNAEFRHFKTL